MGTSFFWFYDILLLAIIAGVTFRGLKKGGVAVIIGTLSVLVAFIAAFAGSTALTDMVYKNYIEEPLAGYIDENVDSVLGENIITDMQKIDMSKAVVGGKFLNTIELTPDSTGKVTLDLSDIDLTETGIQNADLSIFGINSGFDYSLVKVGIVEISEHELKNNSLETIVLARVLAANTKSGNLFEAFENIGNKISEAIPVVFDNFSKDIENGNSDIIYSLILSVTDLSYNSRSEAILSNIIDPIVIVPLRIIFFLIIFTVVILILNAIANASKIINHIPLISSVNELLGGILGFVKAIIIILIICIFVRFLISLTGDSLLFINTYTIENTLFFKYVYDFDIFSLVQV